MDLFKKPYYNTYLFAHPPQPRHSDVSFSDDVTNEITVERIRLSGWLGLNPNDGLGPKLDNLGRPSGRVVENTA